MRVECVFDDKASGNLTGTAVHIYFIIISRYVSRHYVETTNNTTLLVEHIGVTYRRALSFFLYIHRQREREREQFNRNLRNNVSSCQNEKSILFNGNL